MKDIGTVINFDFPNNVEDYVHRIGRTGRAGAFGVSHTFFTAKDGYSKTYKCYIVTCIRWYVYVGYVYVCAPLSLYGRYSRLLVLISLFFCYREI